MLGGGLSTRIGQDKGEIEVAGKKLLDRAILNMTRNFAEGVYVTNDLSFKAPSPELIVTNDEIPHLGPLGGISAGLKTIGNQKAFVAGYDMPFVETGLIELLIEEAAGAQVAVPKIGGKLEPLHAVYDRTCLGAIDAQLTAGRRKIINFYADVSVKEVDEAKIRAVDPGLRSFFNVNTWDDVEAAIEMLGGQE